MFEHHFGLRENPFVAGHHARFVYPSPEHQEALAHLRFGIENREPFVLITGEVGTGKTTAIYDALGEWQTRVHVALITNSALTRNELLEEIALRFGVSLTGGTSKPQVIAQLERLLVAIHQQGDRAILLLDEAQNLGRDLLEEIRLLSNLEISGQKLMQVFLVGQPELEAKLARPELRQLRQRITVHYRLNPLTADDTERYIHHRISVAGGHALTIFPPAACREVYGLTHGIPREINNVCAQALLNAFVEDAQSVSPAQVLAAASDTEFQSVIVRGAESMPGRVVTEYAAMGKVEVHSEPSEPAADESGDSVDEAPEPEPTEEAEEPPTEEAEELPTEGDEEFWTVTPSRAAPGAPPRFEPPVLDAEPVADAQSTNPRPVAPPPSEPPVAESEPLAAVLPPPPTPAAPPQFGPPVYGTKPAAAIQPPARMPAAPTPFEAPALETEPVGAVQPPPAPAVPPTFEPPVVESEPVSAVEPPPPAPAARPPFEPPAIAPQPTGSIAIPAIDSWMSARTSPRAAEQAAPPAAAAPTQPPTVASETQAPRAQHAPAPTAAGPVGSEPRWVTPSLATRSAPEHEPSPHVRSLAAEQRAALPPRLRERLSAATDDERPGSNVALLWVARAAGVAAIAIAVVLLVRFGPWVKHPPAPDAVVPMEPSTAMPSDQVAAEDTPPVGTSDAGGTVTPSEATTTPAREPVIAGTTEPGVRATAPPAVREPAPTRSESAGSRTVKTEQPTADAGSIPAKSASVPPVAKPAAPRASYGVAVATFLFEDRANEERVKLAASTGLPVHILTVQDGGTDVYRVVLGVYPDRGAAERGASDLVRRGLVDEARVVSLPRSATAKP